MIPGLGDYIGLMLGIYQLFLCSLFGLPLDILAWMLLNLVIDCVLGLIPFFGDLLDVAFRANLRNLRLFEDHLSNSSGKCRAGQFFLYFPSNKVFIPREDELRFAPPHPLISTPVPPLGARTTATATNTPLLSSSRLRPLPLTIPTSLTADLDRALAEAHVNRPGSVDSVDDTDGTASLTASPEEREPSSPLQTLFTQQPQDHSDVEGYSIPEPPDSYIQPIDTSSLLGGESNEPRCSSDFDSRRLSIDERSNDEESHLIGTSPQSIQVHRRGRDPILDLGVSSSRSSMVLQHPHRVSQEPGNDKSDSKKYATVSNSAADLRRARSELLSSRANGNEGSGPDPSSHLGVPGQHSRRGVSWHESIMHPRRSIDSFDAAEEADWSHSRGSSSGEPAFLRREHHRGRRSVVTPTEAAAEWRRRRTLYMVVYSAIFCVAYVTSLDANTGYLYLNFACSEYGALASFSTVAIVQQIIFAVAKPPIAKLSDVLGRAQAYVLSIALYASGYALVASTGSLQWLIGGICLQSAGFTGVQVLQSIIIADTTTAKWRGLAIGIVNLPYLINFAVAGPLVDRVMRDAGWRTGYALWTVIVPLASMPLLITLAIGQKRARKAGLATRTSLLQYGLRELMRELDAPGLLLFTSGWLLILIPLTLAGHAERSESIPGVFLFVLGAILLAIFGWWETKAPAPILPYQFLKNRAVVCVCVVGVLDFASFYISWTYLSSFVQVIKGWDQTRTGYFASTQNVTSTLTGILVGSLMALTRRFKTLLVAGLVVRLLGVAMMVRYRTAEDPTVMLVLCQLLQGIGGGSIAITMQVAVQVTVRHTDVAIVTALELLTTEIGAAMGSATAGWMFKSYLPTALAEHLPNFSEQELAAVYGSLQAALAYPIGSEERHGIIQAWTEVMRHLCVTATITMVPALLFGLAIPDTSLPDHHHHHHHHHHSPSERRRSNRRSRSVSKTRASRRSEAEAAR